MDNKKVAASIAEGILRHCDRLSEHAHGINRSLRRGNDAWKEHIDALYEELGHMAEAWRKPKDEDDATYAGTTTPQGDA